MTRDELLRAYAGGRRNFRGANLRGADLEGADIEGADLRGALLRGADLGRTNLMGANLRGANLGGASLRRADLRRASIEGASLGEANLEGANIRRASLEGVYLEEADLRRADLRGAYLEGADLRRVNLVGADLRMADLRGASFAGAVLGGGARWHESGVWTQLPPQCEVGGWWAACLAPGVIRIGCTTLPLDEWLGVQGEHLAEENDVSPMDQHVLRCWAEMLADLGDHLPGWVPDLVADGLKHVEAMQSEAG